MNKRRIIGLALLALSAAACRRDPTLLVRNTSGVRLDVSVGGGGNLFVRDTVQPGASWCWVVPEFARREALGVAISYNTSKVAVGMDEPWLSGDLNERRSWVVWAHAADYVPSTPEWEAMNRAYNDSLRRLIAEAPMYVVEWRRLAEQRLYDQPGAPHYRANVTLAEAGRCKPGAR